MKVFDLFSDLTKDELACLDRSDRAALVAEAEAMRIEAVRAAGRVPPEVGPEIPEAPARGLVGTFDMMRSYPDGADGFVSKPAGFMGRKTLGRADSFDVMAAKAASARKPNPFSPGQVAMGRYYRDLVEKHANAGVKCSSLESLSQGSGGGGSFIDAVLRDRQRIGILQARIGDRSALVVRRHRPSSRGSRSSIMDRRLVDMVCLEDKTISDVLRAHGWAIKGGLVADVQQALADALDRMMGPVRSPRVGVVHFGMEG